MLINYFSIKILLRQGVKRGKDQPKTEAAYATQVVIVM